MGAVDLAAALGALLLFLRRRKLKASKPPQIHNAESDPTRAEMFDESGRKHAPGAARIWALLNYLDITGSMKVMQIVSMRLMQIEKPELYHVLDVR